MTIKVQGVFNMASEIDKQGFWRKKSNGKIHYFEKKNNKFVQIKKKQKKVGTNYYYFNSAGVMVVDTFQKVTNSNGKQKICYYDANGKRCNQQKKTINGDTVFFNTTSGNRIGRINKLTYINQSKGVRQNGKWTNTGFPGTHVWNYNSTHRTISMAGCGITCCAMIITALTGKLVLPTKFNSINYGFNGIGSNWNVGILTTKKYDLNAKVRAFTKDELKTQLLAGRYVLCWVTHSIYGAMGNTSGGNTGSGGGHFILIYGYKDGKFAIADPNNLSQTYCMSSPHKLQTFESFNSHLGNGKDRSYTLIWK